MTQDLSPRLISVANMVTPGNIVYDVGCDHAFLSIYLVQNGIAKSAVASDVRTGPLSAAKDHVQERSLDGKIRLVLSDGIKDIDTPPEGSSLIMAGMGGELIMNILSADTGKTHAFDEIIISPQSHIEDVRNDIRKIGLYICDEDLVRDQGKFYFVMKLTKATVTYGEFSGDVTDHTAKLLRNRYGPVLIDKRHGMLKEYLIREHDILTEILQKLDVQKHSEKIREVEEDLHLNEFLTGGLYGNDQDR